MKVRGDLREALALERQRQMQNADMGPPQIDRALLANSQSSSDRNRAAAWDDIGRGVAAGVLAHASEPWWKAFWRRM